MKNLFIILIFTAIIFCGITLWFYLKPAVIVNQNNIENEIPVKISPYNSEYGKDSILVYIPYKMEVSNNRLHKIEMNAVEYENNLNSPLKMYFDNNGLLLGRENHLDDLEELLEKKDLINYFRLYYNREIFPSSSKQFYFYKAFLLSKNKLTQDHNQNFELLKDFSEKQNQRLDYKSKFRINRNTADSLYESDYNRNLLLFFNDAKPNRSNRYKIKYQLKTGKQLLTDYSEMSRQDLLKEMNKPLNFGD